MVCRAREFRDRSLGSVPGTFCYDKADRNEAKLFFEQDRMEVLIKVTIGSCYGFQI